MFETFQRWFPEDFEAARKEGLETGRMEVCADLVKQGLLSLEDAASHAGVSPERLAEFIKGRETN